MAQEPRANPDATRALEHLLYQWKAPLQAIGFTEQEIDTKIRCDLEGENVVHTLRAVAFWLPNSAGINGLIVQQLTMYPAGSGASPQEVKPSHSFSRCFALGAVGAEIVRDGYDSDKYTKRVRSATVQFQDKQYTALQLDDTLQVLDILRQDHKF